MDRILGKSGDQINDFCKTHTGEKGGILGIICVNGKIKHFWQEFPQTLTYDSFEDVMREMSIALAVQLYDRRIVVL
jgi:hypothetical protein